MPQNEKPKRWASVFKKEDGVRCGIGATNYTNFGDFLTPKPITLPACSKNNIHLIQASLHE